MRVTRRTAALGGMAFALASPAPVFAQGYTLAPKELGFSVALPKQPQYDKHEPAADDGTTFVLHRYVVEANPSYFAVSIQELTAKTDVSNPRRYLEAKIADEGRMMRGGKYDRVEWSMTGGVPAVTVLGHKDANALRILHALKGRRLYTLTYAGSPGSAASAAAARFTRSFRLVP